MKMSTFWAVAPCCLKETDQCFRCAYCAVIRAMIMKAVSTSETSVKWDYTAHY
jgi:hypothetical protein